MGHCRDQGHARLQRLRMVNEEEQARKQGRNGSVSDKSGPQTRRGYVMLPTLLLEPGVQISRHVGDRKSRRTNAAQAYRRNHIATGQE